MLETAQQSLYGYIWAMACGPNSTVGGWLGELMLEVDRPRDAERYIKSFEIDPFGERDPFTALRLGEVYEELKEFEEARTSYEYSLQSWRGAEPELQPRIEAAHQALARLPKPLPRDAP